MIYLVIYLLIAVPVATDVAVTPTSSKLTPIGNMVASSFLALIWPVTLLLVVGITLRRKWRGPRR